MNIYLIDGIFSSLIEMAHFQHIQCPIEHGQS